MKNKIRKKQSKNKRLVVSPVKDKNISQQAVDLLIQVVRGELIKDKKGEVAPPTIAQRLAAAQMLLKIRREEPETESDNGIGVALDLPQRSQNFEEWLRRTQAMKTTENP